MPTPRTKIKPQVVTVVEVKQSAVMETARYWFGDAKDHTFTARDLFIRASQRYPDMFFDEKHDTHFIVATLALGARTVPPVVSIDTNPKTPLYRLIRNTQTNVASA